MSVVELDIAGSAVGLLWPEEAGVAVGLLSQDDCAALPPVDDLVDEIVYAKDRQEKYEGEWVRRARDELDAAREAEGASARVVAQFNLGTRLAALGVLARDGTQYLDEAISYFLSAEQDAQALTPTTRANQTVKDELLGKSKHSLAFALCCCFDRLGNVERLDRAAQLLEEASEAFERSGDTRRAETASFNGARVRFLRSLFQLDDAAAIWFGAEYRSAIHGHQFQSTNSAVAHRVWLAQSLVQAAVRRADAKAFRLAAAVASEAAQILRQDEDQTRAGSALCLQGTALAAAVRIDGTEFDEAEAVLTEGTKLLAGGPSIVVAYARFDQGLLLLHPGSGTASRDEELDQSAALSRDAYGRFVASGNENLAAKASLNQGLALAAHAQDVRSYQQAYDVCATAVRHCGDDAYLRARAQLVQGTIALNLAIQLRSGDTGVWKRAVGLLAAAKRQLGEQSQLYWNARVSYAQAALAFAKARHDVDALRLAADELDRVAEEMSMRSHRRETGAVDIDNSTPAVARSSDNVTSSLEGVEPIPPDGEEDHEILQTADAAGSHTDLRGRFEVASVEDLVVSLAPEAPQGAIDRLEQLIREAQQIPPEDKVGFVNNVNRLLDALGLRIQVEGQEPLARLTVKQGLIRLSVSGRGQQRFRGQTIHVVRTPQTYGRQGPKPHRQ